MFVESTTRQAAFTTHLIDRRAPYTVWRGASAVPPREFLPDRSGTTEWPVWDTTAHLIVTSPERLVDAQDLVTGQVAAIEGACNQVSSASEVRALQRAHGQPVQVNPLLADLVAISLRAAQLSDGDVDPISDRARRGQDGEPSRTPPDWRSIRRDGREITVPAGALLDLSATARARAADLCAWLIYKRFKVGVLLGIGGDIATAGQAPAGGWRTLIQDDPGAPSILVRPPFTAMATSSVVSRAWSAGRGEGGRPLHYDLCPGTSRSAGPMWRSVAVGAFRCTHARTLSTAALVRGHAAPDWLRDFGVSARLVATDGEVVTVGPWPTDETG
jgi:thiamine biosynthesis lipoprotein